MRSFLRTGTLTRCYRSPALHLPYRHFPCPITSLRRIFSWCKLSRKVASTNVVAGVQQVITALRMRLPHK